MAVLGLGSLFVIGYVLVNGVGGVFQFGGDSGFMFTGGSALVIALIVLVGAALITRSRSSGSRGHQVLGWLSLALAGVLYMTIGAQPGI